MTTKEININRNKIVLVQMTTQNKIQHKHGKKKTPREGNVAGGAALF